MKLDNDTDSTLQEVMMFLAMIAVMALPSALWCTFINAQHLSYWHQPPASASNALALVGLTLTGWLSQGIWWLVYYIWPITIWCFLVWVAAICYADWLNKPIDENSPGSDRPRMVRTRQLRLSTNKQ